MSDISTKGFTADVLSDNIEKVNAIFKIVFGNAWNDDISSPNGQFVNQLANILQNNQNYLTSLFNQWNPNLATGLQLDALCLLLGLYRQKATATVQQVRCFGIAGTVIPKGSRILDIATNNIYESTATATIVTTATTPYVDIIFNSIVKGSEVVEPNGNWNIISTIIGFTSASNTPSGTYTAGKDIEADYDLRSRRVATLGIQGSGFLQNIYANLIKLDSILSVQVFENFNSSTTTPFNVPNIGNLNANSVLIIVYPTAGLTPINPQTETDVATQIQLDKPAGIDMNQTPATAFTNITKATKTIQVPVPNDKNGNTINVSYTATFYYATEISLYISITILGQYDSNLVKQTLINNFNGVDKYSDLPRPTINSIVAITRFLPSLEGIAIVNITSFTLGLGSAGTTFSVTAPNGQIMTLSANNILITQG